MKIMPLTKDVCQELIVQGYNHFETKYDSAIYEFQNPKRIVTYEAVRNNMREVSDSIKHILDLVDNISIQYYVMFKN